MKLKMKLILDIETNGFLDSLDKIHCMVFRDVDTQKVYSYNPDQINEGLELLKKADMIIGHSVMGFDLPAIEKVTGYKYEGEVLDTLLCSRLIWSNMTEVDYTKKNLPPKLIGKHSIESWGFRLGLRKGDFQENNSFDVWSKENKGLRSKAWKRTLQRLKDGTYGFCEETGEPIGLKRLMARPVATLSIEAQEKHERDEKIFIDD